MYVIPVNNKYKVIKKYIIINRKLNIKGIPINAVNNFNRNVKVFPKTLNSGEGLFSFTIFTSF